MSDDAQRSRDDHRSVRLDGDERDEFLSPGGTGVISFDRGDEAPFSIPVSYGYDVESGDLFFRLANDPDGEKGLFLSGRPAVSFVVHRETDDGWRSVVATGRLEEVAEAAVDSSVVEAMRRVRIPLVDVYSDHPRTVEFEFYRLRPDELTGRKEARTGD
jgi:hypothetical protein